MTFDLVIYPVSFRYLIVNACNIYTSFENCTVIS